MTAELLPPRARTHKCATRCCENRAEIYFECGGVGSYYCVQCYLKIEAIPDNRAALEPPHEAPAPPRD